MMIHEVYRASCQGKDGYATRAGAVAVIQRRQKRARMSNSHRKERKREVADLQPYRCRWCHHWHIGHPPQ